MYTNDNYYDTLCIIIILLFMIHTCRSFNYVEVFATPLRSPLPPPPPPPQ